MPKAKYQRFPAPVGQDGFEIELPEKSFLQAEVVQDRLYIAAIFQSNSAMKKFAIKLLSDGDEFDADHIADLGLVKLPFSPPKRVVTVMFLPPEIRAARDAAAAGIIGASRVPELPKSH